MRGCWKRSHGKGDSGTRRRKGEKQTEPLPTTTAPALYSTWDALTWRNKKQADDKRMKRCSVGHLQCAHRGGLCEGLLDRTKAGDSSIQ